MAQSLEANILIPEAPTGGTIRVLSVSPGTRQGVSMVFARRQVALLDELGIINKWFFLTSRTSLPTLVVERRRLFAEVLAFRPHLIHAQYGTITALFCAMGPTTPLVITYRGSDLNPCPSMFWPHWVAGKLFSELAALRATAIICVSQQVKERLWWRRNIAAVIPSGVDTSIFYPRPKNSVRSDLGWGQDERVVLFNSAGLPKVKRLDLAESAIAAAREQCGHIRFVILDGQVEPDHVPLLMNAADCLLLTSDWEGSPNVVKEAIACSLPVVTVDVGDLRDRLKDVYPSMIVDRDPKALGTAICKILAFGSRSNGSARINEIDATQTAVRILGVYRRALQSRADTHLSRT